MINYMFNVFQKNLALHGKFGCNRSSSSIIEDEDKEGLHRKIFRAKQSSSPFSITIVFFFIHIGFHIYYSINIGGWSELFKVSLY